MPKTLKIIFNILFLTLSTITYGQIKPTIYLIPGQGSDARLYKNLTIDSSYEVRHILYSIPKKGDKMIDFAKTLSVQIDTTSPFILIGVSIGGMLSSEINEFLNPLKTIIISSAKCRNELPNRYTFQKKLPIYKLIGGRLAKVGAKIMQPIVEPDRNKDKATFKSMLNDKDPKFLKRTIKMILEWSKVEYNSNIIHIHGNNDKTIPIKNVGYDYLIENGSHMMALTRGNEISKIINRIIAQK